jgi:hypothetical protein
MNAILEEVKPETAALIASQAKAQGLSVDDYLRSILPVTNGNGSAQPLYETLPPEELATAFDRWADSHEKNGPGLTLDDVSREGIYEGR